MIDRKEILAAIVANSTPNLIPHDHDEIIDRLILRAWLSKVSGPPVVKEVSNV